jgi:DNA-binding NtrC family response regulator
MANRNGRDSRVALSATNWNRKQAAEQMQIDYKALLYKMKVLSIEKPKAVSNKGPHSEVPLRRAEVQ